MTDILSLYEAMSALTAEMVMAARAQEWDRLSELEARVADMREKLVRVDPVGIPQALDDKTRQRKTELILRMLEDDREIRVHTEPWMQSVRTLLAGNVRERNVRLAYGSAGQ